MSESEKRTRLFKRTVLDYYKKEGRHNLPWRSPALMIRPDGTLDPYRITVSEVMLQQTQVSRVVDKYKKFLSRFPTVRALSRASLAEVLAVWSGLGYNRRAQFLHQMARVIVEKHKGTFPKTIEALEALPGIGSYSARAIGAFAYNIPSVCIETNIRTVYLHHFFRDASNVSDKDILPIIESTLKNTDPRTWYWALMDYGAHLKRSGIHAHRASAQHKIQSPFRDSKRRVRGIIVRQLLQGSRTLSVLKAVVGDTPHDVTVVVADLVDEGIVKKRGERYSLVSS